MLVRPGVSQYHTHALTHIYANTKIQTLSLSLSLVIAPNCSQPEQLSFHQSGNRGLNNILDFLRFWAGMQSTDVDMTHTVLFYCMDAVKLRGYWTDLFLSFFSFSFEVNRLCNIPLCPSSPFNGFDLVYQEPILLHCSPLQASLNLCLFYFDVELLNQV